MVDYLYDAGIDDVMSRVTSIQMTGAHVSYQYLGAKTVVVEDYGDIGVTLDYSADNFAAWDRFGRREKGDITDFRENDRETTALIRMAVDAGATGTRPRHRSY